MDLTELLDPLAPIQVIGEPAVEIADLAYDSRAVPPGSLFFCVPGGTTDGHEFADWAVEAGASALVVQRPVSTRVPQVVVGDVRTAMALAAAEFFGRPTDELQVAAVTGTNGKTTTTFLLHSILEAAGRTPGLLGTIESRVGDERRPAVRTTPEAIDLQRTFREMLEAGNRSVALEATSHGSVQNRLLGTRLACLVFTNLSQEHLDFHGTMEAYYEAKKRLFTGVLTGSDPVNFTGSDPVKDMPAAAVNLGDPYGRRLAEELRRLGGRLVTFGFADDADLKPGEVEVNTRLRGRFNVENVLGAIAAGRLLGIDDETIVAGIERLEGVPGRFESVDEGQPFTVLVDYAHTPEALENVLRAARDLDTGRLICVFGCGGDRDRGKRPVMGRIAGELADLAIVTSDNPRSEDPRAIIDEILAGAESDLEVEADRREAIARAVEEAQPGDVIVIAGKGHEQGQQFRDRTVPFDDREVAREALKATRGGSLIPLSLDEIEALCPGRFDRAPWTDEATGVQIDSRHIEEGDLFVGIGDGADYLPHAFARGAAAVLIPDSPFPALAALGSAVRARSSARVIGITGSTGKTSTKDILAALCRPHARTVAAEGGHNNEIGLPLTLTRIDVDTQVVVCEMGMRGIGQIAELCATARPEIGIITSIGPVHLELLGTVERVAQAKAEIVGALPAGGTAVVPDEPLLEPFVARDDIEVCRFRPDDVIAFEPRDDGSRVRLRIGERELELDFPFTARYQALNALAALHAYDALGLPLDQAQAGAAAVTLSRWRGEEIELPSGGLLINDAYNANPVSMKAALQHLIERAGDRRKVAILGEMAELGDGAPELHAEVGRTADVDVLLAIGPLARNYGGTTWVETVDEALGTIEDVIRPGDAILVKASRALGLERVAEAIQAVTV